MSSVDADVNIQFNFKDNATGRARTAKNEIDQAWTEMRNTQRRAQREFELNNRTLTATSRVLTGLSFTVGRVLSLYNTWNLLQLRVQDANQNLRDSQRDLDEVLAQFGENSPEFQKALERNAEVMEEQKRVQRDVAIGYAIMMTQMIASSGQLVTTVIPRIKKLNTTLAGTGSRLGTIAKIGGGIAGGALVGAGIMTSQALSETELSTEEKLASVAESTLGGALLGATIGSVVPGIGTAIGGAVGAAGGAAVGIGTNFGKEISDFIQNPIQVINNIFAPTSQEIVTEISEQTKRSLTYQGG